MSQPDEVTLWRMAHPTTCAAWWAESYNDTPARTTRTEYRALPAAAYAALLARVEAAEGALAEAQRNIAEMAGGTLTIHELIVRNGKIDATFGGEIVQEIGLLFVDAYRKAGAVNYLEMTFHGKTEAGELERFTMTIQRVNGKTPHECRVEAERERDAALTALRASGTREGE